MLIWPTSHSELRELLAYSLLLSTLVGGGCASYTPAPIATMTVAAQQRVKTIELDAVRAELSRIAPGYPWSGEEWNCLTLLAAALTTNPDLALAHATVAASRAEAAAAHVSPGPTLTLTTEYAFNPVEPSPWLYGIGSDLVVDRGGRKQGRIEAADVSARIAAFDYTAAVWSIRMGLRRALDSRSIWQAQAAVAGSLVALRQRQFESASRRLDAGEDSRLDLDRIRADAANDNKIEAAAVANIVSSELDLAAALGLPRDGVDFDRIVPAGVENPIAVPPITDEQLASALEARSEILRAVAGYDRAEAELRIAVASQYPEIRVGPGYTWERGLSKLPVSLSFTLPSSDRARAMINAAETRRAEAGRRLEAAVALVTASIVQAEATYRAALTVLDLVRSRTLPPAEALAKQADVELAAGLINRADWAQSQAGLLGARLDEINAIRSVLEATATLEDALRQPLRGAEMAIGSSLTNISAESDR